MSCNATSNKRGVPDQEEAKAEVYDKINLKEMPAQVKDIRSRVNWRSKTAVPDSLHEPKNM